MFLFIIFCPGGSGQAARRPGRRQPVGRHVRHLLEHGPRPPGSSRGSRPMAGPACNDRRPFSDSSTV